MNSHKLDELQEDIINEIEQDISKDMSIELQTEVLFEIVKKIIKDSNIRARVVKYKLEKYINSNNPYERLYALNKIISDGKGIQTVPTDKNVIEVLTETNRLIVEVLAKRYVENNIEKEVEQVLMEKQDKYIEEVKLNNSKETKGTRKC